MGKLEALRRAGIEYEIDLLLSILRYQLVFKAICDFRGGLDPKQGRACPSGDCSIA
jgi:hypothetical protein